MAHTIPTREPEEFRAGDTLTWLKELGDYSPDDGWTLKYTFVNSGGQILIVASDNGDGRHLVDEDSTATDDYTPGTYFLQGYVEDGAGARHTVHESYVEIEPGLHLSAYTGGLETRSTVKQTLDALEAVILGKASKDQLSYTIAGRSLSHYSPEELLTWRSEYQRLWKNEKRSMDAAAGRSTRRHLKIRPSKAS